MSYLTFPPGISSWQPSVASSAALPSSGNTTGDLRQALDTGSVYRWSGSAWVLWASAGATGNVVGPGSSTDNAVARFDSTTGKIIQNSTLIVADDGSVNLNGQIYNTVPATLTPSGTTQTVDWSAGNVQVLTLASASGNVTVTLSNGQDGGCYTLKIIQASTARTIAWTTAKWPGGTVPTISTANGAVDVITFMKIGGVYYGLAAQNFS